MFMSQTQLFQEQKVSGIRSVTSLNGLKEASVLNKGTHNAQIAKIRKKCSIRGSHWSVLTSKGPSKLRKAEKSFFKGSFLGFNNTVAHQNYSTQRSQISLVLLLGHYVSIHSTTFLIQMFRSQFFFQEQCWNTFKVDISSKSSSMTSSSSDNSVIWVDIEAFLKSCWHSRNIFWWNNGEYWKKKFYNWLPKFA